MIYYAPQASYPSLWAIFCQRKCLCENVVGCTGRKVSQHALGVLWVGVCLVQLASQWCHSAVTLHFIACILHVSQLKIVSPVTDVTAGGSAGFLLLPCSLSFCCFSNTEGTKRATLQPHSSIAVTPVSQCGHAYWGHIPQRHTNVVT